MDRTEGESLAEIEPRAPPKPSIYPQLQTRMQQSVGMSMAVGHDSQRLNTTRKSNRLSLDQSLVVDPRVRDKLGLDRRPLSSASQDTSNTLLNPAFNSSTYVARHIDSIQDVEIPTSQLRSFIPQETIRSVQRKLTKQALNVPAGQTEFHDLVSLKPDKEILYTQPRARISVDENWKHSKETRPTDYISLDSDTEEADIISTPLPQFVRAPINQPVLSISSLELNFEDAHCLRFFETPLVFKGSANVIN
ncbi:hypothetical protein BJ741DRAFT_420426 [Chytriomyces cf. hyalinus JEL632]|nr:hypothetical protein BJ741DRAFT_420426 [Chytriomyces cf. hyalinus JEL632]